MFDYSQRAATEEYDKGYDNIKWEDKSNDNEEGRSEQFEVGNGYKAKEEKET